MDQKETFEWMRSEIERLLNENERLKAQFATASKPVTDEGISDLLLIHPSSGATEDANKFCTDVNVNIGEAFLRGMERAAKLFDGLCYSPFYPPNAKIREAIIDVRLDALKQGMKEKQ